MTRTIADATNEPVTEFCLEDFDDPKAEIGRANAFKFVVDEGGRVCCLSDKCSSNERPVGFFSRRRVKILPGRWQKIDIGIFSLKGELYLHVGHRLFNVSDGSIAVTRQKVSWALARFSLKQGDSVLISLLFLNLSAATGDLDIFEYSEIATRSADSRRESIKCFETMKQQWKTAREFISYLDHHA